MRKAFTLAEVLITIAIIGVIIATIVGKHRTNTENSDFVDNTKSEITHNVIVSEEFSDNEINTTLGTDIDKMNLDSCKELVIRKYNNNKMKIYCRR